jgi:hypothetical protein
VHVARYEVTVQGQGIALPLDTAIAVGFLRLVQVRARTPVEAEIRAVRLVATDWAASAYAFRNRGGTPYLTIRQVGLLSWWHRILGAPKGYLFFAADGVHLPQNPDAR